MEQKAPSRRLDAPEPGYFLIRLVRNGPLVPAAIFHEFGVWRAEVLGEDQPSPHEDPLLAGKVTSIWHSFRERITRAEYLRRCGRAADPADPSSRPHEAVDLSKRPRF